jgi:hypothetical protein
VNERGRVAAGREIRRLAYRLLEADDRGTVQGPRPMLDRHHDETAQEARVEPVALGQEQHEIVRSRDGFADVNRDVRRRSALALV